jgi:hypothetical protein
VRGGDTLKSVAQALWGDSAMWYLIAEANGLSGTQTLSASQMPWEFARSTHCWASIPARRGNSWATKLLFEFKKCLSGRPSWLALFYSFNSCLPRY